VTGLRLATRSDAEDRAYRLRAAESVGEGVARVARGRIDNALDELRGRTGRGTVEAIHESRKDVKKLRALLRLVRGGLPEATFRTENVALRDIGRGLSGVRDADVMLATLDGLEERYPGELPPDAAGGLRQALEANRRSVRSRGSEGTAAQALADVRVRVESWVPSARGFDDVAGGLRRTYRDGRRAQAAATSDPSTELLHDWRKRVKDHWYHLTLLREAWPNLLSPLAGAAHDLSVALGDEHDLGVLTAYAREHVSGLDGLDEMAALTSRRQRELRSDAFGLGARLYADRPRDFTRRMGTLWIVWRPGE